MSQYNSLLRFPSIRMMRPTPCAVIIPHTVTFPPPCFTFFFVNHGSKHSPGLLQHHSIPSEPKTWNMDSSEKLTALQLSTVQSSHSSAQLFCTCRFLWEMNGTASGKRGLVLEKPKLLWVSLETIKTSKIQRLPGRPWRNVPNV